MKEVKLNRYAGPYRKEAIPFKHYVQLPIGLVPKAGNKTRLIFHLSFDFKNGNKSINSHTPQEFCSVQYKDLDHAIRQSIYWLEKLGQKGVIYYSKSDLTMAFRLLPIKFSHRKYLLMKARHPVTLTWMYFIDKCLPFGSSISCAHFQLFSDALAAIFEAKLGFKVTNYLDDFLFVIPSEEVCNNLLTEFINICQDINCPISKDKTEKASSRIIFLGILLDGVNHLSAVPADKLIKAINLLTFVLERKKVTIKVIQKVTGVLNFLQRAIVPGRTFTRQLYDKLKIKDKNGNPLKHYHNVRVDKKVQLDCEVWLQFFHEMNDNLTKLCRPFVDLDSFTYADTLNLFSDASKAWDKGYGCVFKNRWMYRQWPSNFIQNFDPSIEFLELYALCTGLLTWGHLLTNVRIVVFCDNQAVVGMVNKLASPCEHCMHLIRLLVKDCLVNNRRVFVKFVPTHLNSRADALSRINLKKFWKISPLNTLQHPDAIHHELIPIEKVWSGPW